MTGGTLTVDVVTVCLNERDAIARCMNSVFAQTHPAVRYVVMDGGSHDGTADYVASEAARLAHYESGPDGGIFEAMNRALSHCTGDLVYFLNADDYFFDDEVVARAVARFEASPALDILAGRVRFFNTPVIDGRPYQREDFSFGTKLELYRRPIPQQCVFVRRALFARIGHFDRRYRMCADYAWLIRAIDAGVHIAQVDDCFCHFDYCGVSFTSNARRKREKNLIILRQSSPADLLRYVLGGLAQRLRHESGPGAR